MYRLFPLAVVFALLACSGCGDSHEDLAKEGLSVMKDLVATLETVKDAESARAAKSKLKSLGEKMKALEKRMTELGDPTEDQFKAMEAGVGQEMEQLQMKLAEQMMRVMFDPEISKELQDLNFD